MANKDIKKLTPMELKKQVKKLSEQTEMTIKVAGEDYKVLYDVHFKKTKQYAVLDDLIKFFQAGGENTEILDFATPYTALLVVKHFTSLEVPDEVEEAIILLEALIDLEILDKVILGLPEEEVGKVYELITETVQRLNSNIDEAEAEARRVAEQIQNEEIKEMIEENGKEETDQSE